MSSSDFKTEFEPVGHCIYCGNDNEPLSSEHIVPFGLGGNLVLPKASCQACAKITSKLEDICLRNTFIQIRVRYHLATRRPKKRPDKFPIFIHHPDGSEMEKIIQGHELPMWSWCLPLFGTTGFELQLAPDKSPLPEIKCEISQMDAQALLSYGEDKRSVGMNIGKLHIESFARMLAKIGHAFAYASLGVDGFQPCLTDLILKGSPHFGFWVGGETECPPSTQNLYQLHFSEISAVNGLKSLGVGIRLFPYLGTPQYGVIVGSSITQKFSLLTHRAYARPVIIKIIDNK